MWQEELKHNIRKIDDLGKLITFSEEEREDLEQITHRFPMSISRHYFSLINREDPNDPIRRLCVPCAMEFDKDGLLDTSGEADNTKINGLQHKYGPTGLMLSTNQCASYCRFCFRRRLVGLSNEEIMKRMEDVTEYVRQHPEIDNLLISGGDSFMNSNELIRHLLELLSGIDSLKYVRFGTRMLAFLPERVYDDQEFLDILAEYNCKKQIYVIAHFEHPNEMCEESLRAVQSLKKIGIPIKNQAVLLKGVNDNPKIIAELMNKLTYWGIAPYYIFQCRPVLGVKKQFQVPFIDGYKIIDEAKKYMSGPAKQFRYAMSHVTGKIEIIGMIDESKMIFKYHQAKNLNDNARIMVIDVSDGKTWLSDEDVRG